MVYVFLLASQSHLWVPESRSPAAEKAPKPDFCGILVGEVQDLALLGEVPTLSSLRRLLVHFNVYETLAELYKLKEKGKLGVLSMSISEAHETNMTQTARWRMKCQLVIRLVVSHKRSCAFSLNNSCNHWAS